MRPEAPYMPVVTIGLLSVLEQAGFEARARWRDGLLIEVDAEPTTVAELIAEAPRPILDKVSWPTSKPQALGPSLRATTSPIRTYRELTASAGPAELRLLRALATDQAVDDARTPSRTRLLRGAKSDLSAFRDWKRVDPGALTAELLSGPRFEGGESGRGLGLVPEVQTFGGTVGREASTIGAESELLSTLLRHGILALPPVGCGSRKRIVGGPLIDDDLRLSWPQWSISCGLSELRAAFGMRDIHASPSGMDAGALRLRGITAVYRSAPHQLSTTVAVFRWGRRVV
jgi:hypothetical protein